MKVCVVGEMLCDFFAVDGARPHAVDVGSHFQRIAGGAPANFATGLARQGIATAMLSLVGDDPMGRFLLASLASEGVDVSRVARTRRAKTGVSFVSVARDGNRSFDFYRVPSADMLLDRACVEPHLPLGCALVHFGSNSLIHPEGREAVALAVASAHAGGALRSCDLNLRAHLWPSAEAMREQAEWAVRQADWMKMSDEEIEPLTGQRSPEGAAEWCFARGCTCLVLTLGEAGAMLFQRERLRVDAAPCVVVDTTGAGDAFYSGFVGARLRGLGDAQALACGARNAASVCATIGATPGLRRD
jgi:fructokinase